MLDAYSIRKAIPRIVIAVVGINLSIYLCVLALDVTIIIGRGMNDLLVSPFAQAADLTNLGIKSDTIANGTAGILGILGTGALLSGLIGLLMSGGVAAAGVAALGAAGGILFLLTPIIILIGFVSLAILFTLLIRQALLVLLTVVSPVAIACYILPGTEKYFKQWWDLYLKTLLVYPIIAVIFAMSNVMCMILLSNAGGEGAGNTGSILTSPASVFNHGLQFAQTGTLGLVQILVAIVALYAPLVLIPFAFKLAGGAIGAVMNMANAQARKGSGWSAGKFDKAKQNQDGMVGKFANKVKDARIQSGLTSRQVMSRRPGGVDRTGRMAAAREHDQKQFTAQSAESFGMKAYAQDSDVMQSMIMSDKELTEERNTLNEKLTKARSSGDTAGERTALRQLQAHSIADRIGRTKANQRAAFLNADRIKYSPGTGEAGFNTALSTAERIFDGDQGSIAESMNAFQAIAAGPAGRADLTGSLYGEPYSKERVASKVSAGQVLSGYGDGVKGVIEESIKSLESQSTSVDQKEAAVQMLTSLQSNASSPYGAGSEGNKALVKQRQAAIDEALKHFANGTVPAAGPVTQSGERPTAPNPQTLTSSYHQGSVSRPTGRQVESREMMNGRAVNVTQSEEPIKLTGSAAAQQRINQQAGQSPDSTEIQRQQAEQLNKPPEPKE